MKKRLIYFLPYLTFALLSLLIFLKPLNNCDELWNYNFARNIYIGNIPYNDFNMLQTPLSAYFCVIFLFIFGQSFISYRIAGYVVFVLIFCMLYKIGILIQKNKTLVFIFVTFMLILNIDYAIYNYNYLSLLIVLFIVHLEFKQTKERKLARDILIGLLVGIVIFIKQNIGLFLCIAYLIISVIDIVIYKCKFKNIFLKMSSILFVIVDFVVISALMGNLYSFWDYTVVGIKFFTHRHTYIQFMCGSIGGFLLGLSLLCVVIYLIVHFILIFKNKMYSNHIVRFHLVFFIISLAYLMLIYPLCEDSHFILAILPIFTLAFSISKFKKTSKIENIICNVVCLAVVLFVVIYNIPSQNYVLSHINHYDNILIDKQLQENIINVSKYIEQKTEDGYEVYIIGSTAVLYMIPLDRYNKNLDMLLVGNMGSNKVKDLIKDGENILYLVEKEGLYHTQQEHFECKEYVTNNYKLIDEIEDFNVYKKAGL